MQGNVMRICLTLRVKYNCIGVIFFTKPLVFEGDSLRKIDPHKSIDKWYHFISMIEAVMNVVVMHPHNVPPASGYLESDQVGAFLMELRAKTDIILSLASHITAPAACGASDKGNSSGEAMQTEGISYATNSPLQHTNNTRRAHSSVARFICSRSLDLIHPISRSLLMLLRSIMLILNNAWKNNSIFGRCRCGPSACCCSSNRSVSFSHAPAAAATGDNTRAVHSSGGGAAVAAVRGAH